MVSVRAYERQRNGRPEHVSAYTRSGRAGQENAATTPRPSLTPVQLGPFLLAPKPPVPLPRARVVPRGTAETPETGSLPKDPRPLRQKKPGLSGKEASSDAPSWAKIQPRGQNESAAEYATRLMDNKYGRGKWESDPSSEYNKIKKYDQRSFIEWLLNITPEDEIL